MVDVLNDLDRESLETTYFSFSRPKVEYGCHICENCIRCDSDMLEHLQLGIARIVTGARKGIIHEALGNERNWQTLSEQHKLFKLKNFIKHYQ